VKFIHRKIPKDKISGFVLCDFGLLPCETAFDVEELKKYGQIYDWGFRTGKLKRSKSSFPQFVGGQSAGDLYTETEVWDALQIVGKHALKNIGFFSNLPELEETLKVLRKSLSYRLGRRYFEIKKVNAIIRKLT